MNFSIFGLIEIGNNPILKIIKPLYFRIILFWKIVLDEEILQVYCNVIIYVIISIGLLQAK